MAEADVIGMTAWRVNPCKWREASTLSQALGIPQAAAMVLAGRGLAEPAAARQFLECSASLPDPFLFADMDSAVHTISAAMDQGRKMVVHGDYDADGITATALMVLGLRGLGADVGWYLPSRFEEGYGLSRVAVQTIRERNASVLITVDCGVNYPAEVALARELGMEVVVIDHHEPGPTLPDCHLIHHVKGDYPHGELCGVGLALKVVHALCVKRLSADVGSLPPMLAEALDLVAVGTIADLAALREENRYYVREGLKLLNLGKRVGFRALAEVSGCAGAIDSGTVAFRIAPRINAAGRLSDPTPPLRLLLTEDEMEARSLASLLHELNGARQDLERLMFDGARKQVANLDRLPAVLVLASEDWHEGVVGIVASRIAEEYHRPAVLLGVREGVAKGSGRSVPCYDLLGGLNACAHLLSVYGGHSQAAGLTLEARLVDDFRKTLEQHADALLSAADLAPTYCADAVLTSEEINAETVEALTSMEPFGSGNPRPRFLLVDTRLRNVGATRNGVHLRCLAEVGGIAVPAIGFGMAHNPGGPRREGGHCVVGAQLRADEWRGSVRPQLVLERIDGLQTREGATRPFRPDTERVVYPARDTAPAGSHGRRSGVHARAAEWPPSVRDLRDHPGRVTAVAQVLGTSETAVLFTVSAARAVELLASRIPSDLLGDSEVAWVDRARQGTSKTGLAKTKVAIVEWEAGADVNESLQNRPHVLVLDPPFRYEQLRLISVLAERGAAVHLVYGEQQRTETASLLRYLLHPRFAMVCLYRALQDAGTSTDEVFGRAKRTAWQEGRVVLTHADLSRARTILEELGLERWSPGKAKLDARGNAAYREAEADYQESVRLCLTL